MRLRSARSFAVTTMLGLLLASSSQAASSRVREIDVKNYAFDPAHEDLHVGDTVKWVNKDNVEHTATATDGSFNVMLPPGGSGEIQLKNVGAIHYICSVHPYMKGELTVTAK